MYQRAIFFIIIIFLFVLGMLGQYQISPENLTTRFSTSAYEVLMLFLLAGEWTLELEKVPLSIEIVRFTAPLVAVASIVLVIAANARQALENYFLRFYRGHSIVIGLGEKSFQFLKTCQDKSHMLIVDADAGNSLGGRARAMGFKLITGDMADEGMYRRLNIGQAEHLIVFADSDQHNVEILLKLRQVLRRQQRGKQRLRVHVHLNDFAFAQQLENYPRFSADHYAVEVYFFSLYDLSARLMLRDYPAELFADVAGQSRVHLAIYGFGRLAHKIVVEASLLFHFRNQGRLRFSIYDEDIEGKRRAFEAAYPHTSSLCDIEYFEQGELYPDSFTGDVEARLREVTQHVICREQDDQNLAAALGLREILLGKRGCNAPIFVRMLHSGGLAQLVHTERGQPEIPDGIYPFGMLDQVLHVDNILSRRLDGLARTMHEMYVLEARQKNPQGALPRAWSQLTQVERKQNLWKADYWPVRLRAIRCESSEGAGEPLEFTAREARLLAIMEHERYVVQKRNDGWVYAEQRSDAARTNPFLLPWEELPQEQRERELHDVETQPAYVARKTGLSIHRKLTIGVTGHRLNKMDVHNKTLRAQLRDVLQGIASAHPDHHFTLQSSLAEGADRLVAELAMDILSARLHVLLPLPYELYLSDFTSAESVAQFQQLVGKAEYCFELPLKFGAKQDLADVEAGNESRNRQYALAGAYMVQRCDYLVAVYDGQPEAGTGGTAQVLNWYRQGEIDPEYRYPDEYFEPPDKQPAFVLSPDP